MTQPLWLFGTHLTIIADHTTTGGQYDLVEGSPRLPLSASIPQRLDAPLAEQ